MYQVLAKLGWDKEVWYKKSIALDFVSIFAIISL